MMMLMKSFDAQQHVLPNQMSGNGGLPNQK